MVDLDRFRSDGVGDTLRSVYSALSRDPNSLANLDQDLPNYAQRAGVPIKSLPQQWLWCETWCSQGTKADAHTIDLCNNPQLKEPKLAMARRIISGPLFEESWDELDAQAKAIAAAADVAAKAAAAAAATEPLHASLEDDHQENHIVSDMSDGEADAEL